MRREYKNEREIRVREERKEERKEGKERRRRERRERRVSPEALIAYSNVKFHPILKENKIRLIAERRIGKMGSWKKWKVEGVEWQREEVEGGSGVWKEWKGRGKVEETFPKYFCELYTIRLKDCSSRTN